MSSKVFLPQDPCPVSPVPWRHVQAVASGSGTIDAAPDFQAQFAQLEQQCANRVNEAHAQGVREGETAGRNRAAAEVQPVIERLSQTIEEIGNLRPRLRKEAEADMIKLSLAIARRVLQRELAVDPEALHGLVLAALERLDGQEISRVRVHPSHAAAVAACLQKSSRGAAIEVIAETSRPPGSVILETPRGNLDASIESQLQEIERGLADRLRKHP